MQEFWNCAVDFSIQHFLSTTWNVSCNTQRKKNVNARRGVKSNHSHALIYSGTSVHAPLCAHLMHPLSPAQSASLPHGGPLTPGQHWAPPSQRLGGPGPGSGPLPPQPVCFGDSTLTAAHACASAQLLS